VISGILLCSVFPVMRAVELLPIFRRRTGPSSAWALLPAVLKGELSLVGRPLDKSDNHTLADHRGESGNGTYLGPIGVTGLVQLHVDRGLTPEERERYELYYAKNQSLLLDVDILMKSLVNAKRR